MPPFNAAVAEPSAANPPSGKLALELAATDFVINQFRATATLSPNTATTIANRSGMALM